MDRTIDTANDPTEVSMVGLSDKMRRCALKAAEEGDRDATLDALESLPTDLGASAHLVDRWLAAERHYLSGRFDDAARDFELLDGEYGANDAPPWMRYRGRQRMGIAHYRLGNTKEALTLFGGMNSMVTQDESLGKYRCDVEALRAHLHETQGDFARAIGCMERAYHSAVKVGNSHRAATAATVLSGYYCERREFGAAARWIGVAEKKTLKNPRSRQIRRVRLRQARLHLELGFFENAHIAVDEALAMAADGNGPDVLAEGHEIKARVLWALGRHDEALLPAGEAAKLARVSRLQALEAQCELTRTLILLGTDRSAGSAREAFVRAVTLLNALSPPPLLLGINLARAVLDHSQILLKKALKTEMRKKLEDGIYRAKQVGDRESWYADAERLGIDLSATLRTLSGQWVQLRHSRVNDITGEVKLEKSREIQLLSPGCLRVFKVLASSAVPMSKEQITDEVNREDPLKDVGKVRQRLSVILKPDLHKVRVGQCYRFTLLRREPGKP